MSAAESISEIEEQGILNDESTWIFFPVSTEPRESKTPTFKTPCSSFMDIHSKIATNDRECTGFAKPKIVHEQVRTFLEHSGDLSLVVRSSEMLLYLVPPVHSGMEPVAQEFAMLNSRSDRRIVHKRDPSTKIPGTTAKVRCS